MSNRVKTMLLLFCDYLLCLLLQLICLMTFSMLIKFSFGSLLYSVFFCLVLFSLLYSRTHFAAKKDLLKKVKRPIYEGFIIALPLAAFNLLLAVGFSLIQSNLIPVRDIVLDTIYSFPDNAPRVATDVLLIDVLTPWIRAWFGTFLGFMQRGVPAFLPFIMPILNLLAGFLGYLAGSKKIFLSDYIFVVKEKVKEKFNE
ncbi:MAG: hypothetical protein IKD21_00920 [Clostridia bacterium]|nr:hypothetical protein [Clostridia bacterium]